MRLTPLEWGLRAPITPRLGGNRWALPRLGKSELNEEKQTTQNTKLRILPMSSPGRRRTRIGRLGLTFLTLSLDVRYVCIAALQGRLGCAKNPDVNVQSHRRGERPFVISLGVSIHSSC